MHHLLRHHVARSRRPRTWPGRVLLAAVAAVAFALFVTPGVARAADPAIAHGPFVPDTDLCAACHRTHHASALTRGLIVIAGSGSEQELCFTCHADGLGADADIANGPDSFGQPSGHTLEGRLTGADLSNTCSSCHEPHSDPSTDTALPRPAINGTSTAGSVNDWCFSCHDDQQSWAGTDYAGVADPVRDERGYPVEGMFPGRTAYLDPDHNAHSRIATTSADMVLGDCRACHASHRGANEYDGLKLTYRPSTTSTVVSDRTDGTYAESCFECHGGQAWWEARDAVDIKSLVTTTGSDPDSFPGHRVETSGGLLPTGAPLPCYDCHNSHGSQRGNSFLINDSLGGDLHLEDAAAIRRFCFTCHASDDGKVWDSVTATYTAVGTQTVEGLRRDGVLLAGQTAPEAGFTTNWLRLSDVSNAHSANDVESCYACHGGRGSAASDLDVHNPARGDVPSIQQDAVTQPCYACHGSYQASMEDGQGSVTGANRTDSYHHVLGGAAGDGDIQASGAFPNSATDIYCITCHQGHSVETSQASLLRQGIDVEGTATASTDYLSSGSYGICLSCHGVSRAKDTVDQKSDGSTSTAVVTGGTGSGGYGASSHQYVTTTTAADGSTFSADCTKCHSDGLRTGGAEALAGDGTHWFDDRRLLAALGIIQLDPTQETLCYRCHSRVSESPGGVPKPTAGKDWFGAASMSTAAENIYREFTSTSRHAVAGSPSGSVECVNCHNVHSVNATSAVSDPENAYASAAYSTDAQRVAFCLKCHDGAAPSTASADSSTYVPWGVSITASGTVPMNKSTNAARAHWTPNGSISVLKTVACSVCHDEHGSNAPKLLGVFDDATATNRIATATISANDNEVCYACHTASTTATQSYDASGYPTDGRWAGRAVYAGTYGVHSRSTVVRPGTSYAGGDCKNCHDVHGTGNTYDELTGSRYDRAYYGFCFDCHNADHQAGLNQWQYYPASAGGTSTDARAGHATVTNGTMPSGSPMPCYDCHNNHGSANPDALEVHAVVAPNTEVIVGDQPAEISMYTAQGGRDAVGVRRFCFTCHTTSDTAKGWNGAALAAVPTGCLVEGIDRISTSARLRLPSTQIAHRESSTLNCEGSGCHGYTYGGTRPANVHDPRVN